MAREVEKMIERVRCDELDIHLWRRVYPTADVLVAI
jgi:hypothetical protein